MNSAAIDRRTGEIHYHSEFEESYGAEDEEKPEWKDCIVIPHKNDLNLGKELVYEFVEENIPGDYERIRQIFSRPGAYAQYKALLDQLGLLQKWHDIENRHQELAVRAWCSENQIELEE